MITYITKFRYISCIFKLHLVEFLDILSITLYGILLNYVSVVPTTPAPTTGGPDEGTGNPGDGPTTNSEHLYVLVHKFWPNETSSPFVWVD